MLYKIIKTDIKHNGQRYPEGSIIDLTEEQAEVLISFLEEVKDTPFIQYSVVQLKELALKENISLEGCKTKASMIAQIEQTLASQAELTDPEDGPKE